MIFFFRKLYNFFKSDSSTAPSEGNDLISKDHDTLMKKFLIVGLGNIGSEYTHTRHNIGFQILDHLAKEEDISFETAKLGDIAEYKLKGRKFILLKPSTYMNLSGKAILYWLNKENIPLENLLEPQRKSSSLLDAKGKNSR